MAASSAAFSDERCIPPSNIKKEVYRGWTALCALEQFSWSLKMCKKLEEESPFSKMADAQLTYEEVEGVARLTIGKVAAGDSSPDKDDENDVQRLIKVSGVRHFSFVVPLLIMPCVPFRGLLHLAI